MSKRYTYEGIIGYVMGDIDGKSVLPVYRLCNMINSSYLLTTDYDEAKRLSINKIDKIDTTNKILTLNSTNQKM